MGMGAIRRKGESIVTVRKASVHVLTYESDATINNSATTVSSRLIKMGMISKTPNSGEQ